MYHMHYVLCNGQAKSALEGDVSIIGQCEQAAGRGVFRGSEKRRHGKWGR